MKVEFANLNKFCFVENDPLHGVVVLHPSVENAPMVLISELEPGYKYLSFVVEVKSHKCINHLKLHASVLNGITSEELTIDIDSMTTVFLPITPTTCSVNLTLDCNYNMSLSHCGVNIGQFSLKKTKKSFSIESYLVADRDDEGGFIINKLPESSYAKTGEDYPLPDRRHMEYGETPKFHMSSGKNTYIGIKNNLMSLGVDLMDYTRILEFGCSNARVLRWFSENHQAEKWGVDIQSEKIHWCIENLAPMFHFATTTHVPHLSFPDQYFDFIFAGSIFTHINELHQQWILELSRITQKNGILYLTFHDEQAISLLQEEENQSRKISKEIRECSVSQRLFSGDFSYASVAPKNRKMLSNVYMTKSYIEYITSPFLELVKTFEADFSGFQTTYVFKKK